VPKESGVPCLLEVRSRLLSLLELETFPTVLVISAKRKGIMLRVVRMVQLIRRQVVERRQGVESDPLDALLLLQANRRRVCVLAMTEPF
jgi:hypothetical protein